MEVHQLREEKSQRLKMFHEARDIEKELCRITGSFPLSEEAIHFAKIPTEHQIGEVGNHIKQLKVKPNYTSFVPEISYLLSKFCLHW